MWRGKLASFCALVWVGKNNIFIISWRVYMQTYTHVHTAEAEGCRSLSPPPHHPPHRTTKMAQRETLFMVEKKNFSMYFVVVDVASAFFLPHPEKAKRCWWGFHFASEHGFMYGVTTTTKAAAAAAAHGFNIIFFSEFHPHAMYRRRNKNLWKDGNIIQFSVFMAHFRKTILTLHPSTNPPPVKLLVACRMHRRRMERFKSLIRFRWLHVFR